MESSLVIDGTGIRVRCRACGQRNRWKYGALTSEVRCGQFKSPLGSVASTLHVDSSEHFRAMVSQSALPILIDFWAVWCGPCKMVAPELEKVAAQAAGRFLVAKVNTDELQDVAASFQVSSIPTLCLMDHGREVSRQAGAAPAPAILKFVEQALGPSL